MTIPIMTLLLALGPLVFFGLNTLRQVEQVLMREIRQSNRHAIKHAILQTETRIQHTLASMLLAADTLELVDLDELDVPYALQLIQKEIPQLPVVALLDKNGSEIAKLSLDTIYHGSDLISRAQDPEFAQAINNQSYIGQVKASDTGTRRLTLAVPLVDPRDRSVSGVLTAEASIRDLLEEIPSMEVGQGGFIYVVDAKGKIIAHPDLSKVLSGQSIAGNAHFQHFLQGEKEHLGELHRHLSPEGVDVLSTGIQSARLGWVFMVEQPAAQALAAVDGLNRDLKLFLAVLVAISIAGTLYLVFGFARPLQKLQLAAVGMGSGNLNQHVDVVSKNEIGRVAKEFNNMAANLSIAAQERERMDWIKTGQVALDNHVRGHQTLQDLARSVLIFLAKYLDARVGTLYVKGDDNMLRLKAGYAHDHRDAGKDVFKMGEGLVGQAALDGRLLLLESVPEDYLHVVSGLGETHPVVLVVVPLFHGETAVGVMEFGFLAAVPDTKTDFLKDISERVAIALLSILEREKLQETLQVSQNQSEELLAQQEELRAANEELEELTRAL